MKTHKHFGALYSHAQSYQFLIIWMLILGLVLPLWVPAKTSHRLAGKDILFVVGNTNLNNGDQAVKDRLEIDLGHTVTLQDAGVSVSDLTGQDLVIISSTISSNALSSSFRTATRDALIPVITWEIGLFDDFDMSVSSNSTVWSGSDYNILLSNHPLAGNGGSTADVFNGATAHASGSPSSSALEVATLPSGHKVYFAYEAGSSMINMNAPARRIAFFLNDNNADDLTTDGWALFDGAICWSLEECGNTAPTASFTVSTQSGPAPLSISFDASASSDPQNDPLTYAWDFNDGATASGVSTSHTYTNPGTYMAKLTVDDGNGLTNEAIVSITVTGNSNYTATGELLFERWDNISGNKVIDLISSANYPNSPDHSEVLTNSFEMPAPPAGSDDEFGAKISGQYIAPLTGNYTFWIAAADEGQLWLSTNHDPANNQLIASTTTWTNTHEWDQDPSQESAPIPLIQGQAYHIEALVKEAFGGQNLAIKIKLPSGVEAGPVAAALFALPGTYPPAPVANETFIKKYGEEKDGEYLFLEKADGNMIAVGAGYSLSSDANIAGKVHVVETDPYGIPQSNGEYMLEVDNLEINHYRTLDPAVNLMSNGEVFYATKGTSGSSVGMSVFRLNPDQRTLSYSKHVELPSYVRPMAAEITPGDNGNLVLVATNANSLLFKFSPTGNIDYSRLIGHRFFEAKDLAVFSNDHSLVIGRYNQANSSAHETELDVSYLDQNGHTVWAKKYVLPQNERVIPKVVANHNDDYAMIAGMVEKGGTEQLFFAKLDVDNQILIEQKYVDLGLNGEIDIQDMIITSDGGYLLSGGSEKFSGNGLSIPFAVKIDVNANIEWLKYYHHGFEGEHTTLYQLQQTQNGGFIMTGGHFNLPYDPNFPGLVIRTNAQGDLEGEFACAVNEYPISIIQQHNLNFSGSDNTIAMGPYTADYTSPLVLAGNTAVEQSINWNTLTGGNCSSPVPDCPQPQFNKANPTAGYNRIITRTPRIEINSIDEILNHEADFMARDLHEEIAYFDGLGRPVQAVSVAAAPDMSDIVSFHKYDANGREEEVFMPFNIGGSLGSFRVDTDADPNLPDDLQSSFYQTLYPNQPAVAQTQFEASPLNRVFNQGAPGTSWQLGQATVNSSYLIYGSDQIPASLHVYYFPLDAQPGTKGDDGYSYQQGVIGPSPQEGHLRVNKILDENGHTSFEFTDRMGRLIMKSVQVSGADPLTATYASTLYIYDLWGQIKYVLPPEAYQELSASSLHDISSGFLDSWCFQYVYDERRRVIEKKVPGADWQHIVYDPLDRPILTQDGNLRENGEWLFTKFDILGRPVLTGKSSLGHTRAILQGNVDDFYYILNHKLYVEKQANTEHGYSNEAFPILSGTEEIHSVSYYDDYDFDRNGQANAAYDAVLGPGVPFLRLQGHITGVKTLVLDPDHTSPEFLETLTFYDDRYREIQTQSDHLEGRDISSQTINFSGEIESSSNWHQGPAGLITVNQRFCYDHRGRLIRTTQQNAQDAEIVLAEQSYDELGRLEEKNLHSADGQQTFLQSVDYSYNIRGWMTAINQIEAADNWQFNNPENDLFRFRLHYENPVNFLGDLQSGGYTPQGVLNGNISMLEWQVGDDATVKAYAFKYDALNRLLEAQYAETVCSTLNGQPACIWNIPQENPGMNDYRTSYSYDLNGNIASLQRFGKTGPGSSDFGLMDDLSYGYFDANHLNRLTRVDDAVTGTGTTGVMEFIDGNTSSDYSYDKSGNITEDLNKGISIEYNFLNKPTKVSFLSGANAGGTIEYIYDAAGTKLEQRVGGTATAKITTYANSFEYENGILVHFMHAEGRVVPSGLGSFRYEYFLKDHLGNNRVSFADLDNDGSIDPVTELLQANDYYPFGMNMSGMGYPGGNQKNQYLYNGKELQDELGLNWLDYGARMYDASIARWNGVDAKAESYPFWSPYNYVIGNPINVIDPDGNDIYVLIWFSKDGETGHAGIAVDNYKTVNKKDSEGNDIIDDQGNLVTEQVKDGTYTYYDLWPEESVGRTELQSDVDPDYAGGRVVNSLSDLTHGDPSASSIQGNVSENGERRAADGIIQLSTSKSEDATVKSTLGSIASGNAPYNACENNCSTYVQDGLSSIIPGFDASQEIRPPSHLQIWPFEYKDSRTVAPNNLYNKTAKQKNATVIKGPPSVVAKPYLEYYGKENRP